MIKWNEVLKKRLWPNGGIIPEFTWMNWKKNVKYLRKVCVPPGNGTNNRRNI